MNFKIINIKLIPFIVVLVLVTVLGMLVAPNDIEKQKVSEETDWVIAKKKFIKPDVVDFNELNKLNLWQEAKIVDNKVVEVKGWFLKGIVLDKNTPYILVLETGQTKLKKYVMSDLLPNGELLVEINANNIIYEKNGELKKISLHQRVDINENSKK